MPIKNSAKKALRQSKKKALANLQVKRAYKNAIKSVDKGLATGKDIKADLKLAQKKLDKAAKKGIIKKNTASRKISRLTKKVNKLKK